MSKFSIDYIKQNPIDYVKNEKEDKVIDFLKKASYEYYNTENTLVSDEIYDVIYDTLKQHNPKNNFFQTVGYEEKSQDKVKLPMFMGSQNKIKTEKELKNWVNKNECENYLITPKIDGSSGLLVCSNGVLRLYSRSNSDYGKNLTHLIKHMNIPEIHEEIILRGELIVSKKNFGKYKDSFAFPRSMVNSITHNKKGESNFTKYLEFVVFEIYNDSKTLLEKLDKAKNLGFKTVISEMVDYNDILLWNSDTSNYLYNKLTALRKNYLYDIDGIIITSNKINKLDESGNPKYSVAFKSNNEGLITKVIEVEWNTSKHGILKPRIKFESINLGSNIQYCTGYSGKYIFNNSICEGALIRVVLSGEIIPCIVEIVKQGSYPSMPNVNYKWDSNRVNIMNIEENDEQRIKKVMTFIKTVNIENMGIGIIRKLFDNGYNTLYKILCLTSDNLKLLDGFETTLSNKLITNIHNVISKNIYLPLIMHGSCEFKYGLGIKKFEKIVKMYPNILDNDFTVTLDMLNKIPSFDVLTSEKFLECLPNFKDFLQEHSMIKYTVTTESDDEFEKKFVGKNIVFTGKRDKELMLDVVNGGGNIQTNLSKRTDYLIVDDLGKKSTKVDKAKALNIEIITVKQFKDMNKKIE